MKTDQPTAQDIAESWIKEAKENISMSTTSEPCVVRGLLNHIDDLREMLEKVFECIQFEDRCGGLDYIMERKVKRALYAHYKSKDEAYG